jgi:hypothetical protein
LGSLQSRNLAGNVHRLPWLRLGKTTCTAL